MEPAAGARTFMTTGAAYDRFMGRYSTALAPMFADAARVVPGQHALDVGCGPGALTGVLVQRLGADAVFATDPSPVFVEACALRNPGVDVRPGRAEQLPYDDAQFDVVLAQLVLHFVTDPALALSEMQRVLKSGGRVGACVWDFSQGMQMLRAFWDAALSIDPDAPDELRVMRFGREGELTTLLRQAGLVDVQDHVLSVSSSYTGFEELWAGLMAGIGPAGSYLVGLQEDHRAALRAALFERVGAPAGGFALQAMARASTGRRSA